MTEENPEESFTFVDKRKVGTESDAAAQNNGTASTPSPVSNEASQPAVEDPASENTIDEDAAQDDGTASVGSYALAAYVAGLIASDAWQKMGLTPDPATGKINRDFAQARFSIDCAAALIGVIDQHQATVPGELRRDLQRVLNDLRLNFIEQQARA